MTSTHHTATARGAAGRHGPDPAFLRRATAATGGGMFLDGFVFATIAAVIAGTAFSRDLGLTPTTLGLVSSSTLVGTMVGSPLIGYLTDRFGRKPMFLVDLGVFLVASLAMLLVAQAWEVLALGVVLGVVIGGDYAIGSPLLGEYTAAADRGRYLAVLEILWNVGYVVAFFVGFVVLALFPQGWRFVLACSAVPAGVILLLRQGLPESPRWLLARGRRQEAEAALDVIGVDLASVEYHDEPEARTQWRLLFSRAYIGRTVFSATFWVCIVIPYFALAFFQSEVLGALGLSNPVAVALLGTCTALLGAAIGWSLIDSVGRRKLLIVPMFATAVFLTLVAVGSVADLPTAVTVISFFGYLLFYGVMSILCGVYPLEVFPTQVRTSGLGVSSGFSRVGAAAATFLVPIGFADLGLAPVLVIVAAVCVIGGVVSLLLAPETAHETLTETGAATVDRPRREAAAA